MTQKELAAELGVSQSHISALEKNEKSPGAEILVSLKRYFKLDLNWLLVGEGDHPQKTETKGKVMWLIEQVLVEMDEDAQRDVLKYSEEKKLLNELLASKRKKSA